MEDAMSFLENYHRKAFDQPTGPALAQIKSILRILQWQGYSKGGLAFLLRLESILEQGNSQESLRAKFLRVLQPEINETEKEKVQMSEQGSEIQITEGLGAGTYNVFASYSKDSITTTARGLLEIAAYVEQHRNQLTREAGQLLTSYSVRLYPSRVTPVGSIPEFSIDAVDAQEAMGRALAQHGARQMKIVVVTSTAKEERFEDVELQQNHSVTFRHAEERLRPQSPL
jgi:hypothetical protein